jgi:hypothetical protein
MRRRNVIAGLKVGLVLVAVLALGGWSCTTGNTTLKAQSATVDTLKLGGVTFKLISGPMDNVCRQGTPGMVDVCDRWYVFVKGKVPADPLCKAPTVAAIGSVLDKCGFRVAYNFIDDQYDQKKDVAVGLASTVEAVTRQLTGFGAAIAPK